MPATPYPRARGGLPCIHVLRKRGHRRKALAPRRTARVAERTPHAPGSGLLHTTSAERDISTRDQICLRPLKFRMGRRIDLRRLHGMHRLATTVSKSRRKCSLPIARQFRISDDQTQLKSIRNHATWKVRNKLRNVFQALKLLSTATTCFRALSGPRMY